MLREVEFWFAVRTNGECLSPSADETLLTRRAATLHAFPMETIWRLQLYGFVASRGEGAIDLAGHQLRDDCVWPGRRLCFGFFMFTRAVRLVVSPLRLHSLPAASPSPGLTRLFGTMSGYSAQYVTDKLSKELETTHLVGFCALGGE